MSCMILYTRLTLSLRRVRFSPSHSFRGNKPKTPKTANKPEAQDRMNTNSTFGSMKYFIILGCLSDTRVIMALVNAL